MKNYLQVISLLVLCFVLFGCMQFSVSNGKIKDEMTKKGDVYWGSYYDFWWKNSPQEDLDTFIQEKKSDKIDERPLYQVQYGSNYLYSLTSVFSLGLAVPVEVRWYLIAKETKPYDGEIQIKSSTHKTSK